MFLAPRGAIPNRAGFTLLELLVAVSIIAVLTGLVLGAGRRSVESGKIARTRAELVVLAAALENYRRAYGDYPRTADGDRLLQSLLGRRGPANQALAGRPFIDTARFTTRDAVDPLVDSAAVLVDAWGQPYVYAYKSATPWTNAGFVLYSRGPDAADWSILLSGGYVDRNQPLNADNVYAQR